MVHILVRIAVCLVACQTSIAVDATAWHVTPGDRHHVAQGHGIDLSKPLNAAAKEFIRLAVHNHMVIVFRNQTLMEEDLVRTADMLGGTQVSGARVYEEHAGLTPGGSKGSGGRSPVNSQINLVTNLGPDGKPVASDKDFGGSDPLPWHTDNDYVDQPPSLTMLYAVQNAGDGMARTSFADQYRAFKMLPSELVERIKGWHVVHDSSRRGLGVLRPSVKKTAATYAEVPGAHHPIVRLHPDSRRPALYLGRRYENIHPTSHITEMPNSEGDQLLELLWSYAIHESHIWFHDWQKNDLLIWDNQCVVHSRSPGNSTQPRVMMRALIQGKSPVGFNANASSQVVDS